MRVVLYSPEDSCWMCYDRPQRVLTLRCHEEILPALRHMELAVERQGLHAAGFLAYEAGAAFDAAMPKKQCAPFPLACFGLFDPPRPISLPSPASPMACSWESELTASEHACALTRIRQLLAQGESYQVNFTYRLRTRFDADPWAYFGQLMAAQPSRHGAYVDCGDFAVCCASPEAFFWRNGEEVWSRPMKGTAPRGRFVMEDRKQAETLRASAKDRAENVMIVDMVRNDLGRICLPGSVSAPELFRIERYPTVWQMTSLVHGRSTASTADILAALFPAASITGAPKIRTMQAIAELECSPRRIYTGSIGVLTPGRQARFNVAIRTVLVDRNSGTAEYGVGGGIVWDSDPQAEYRETLLKAQVLRQKVDMFELLETMRWTREEGIFLRDEHMRRLAESAEYFGFSLDLVALGPALEAFLAELAEDAAVIRLLLARDGQWTFQIKPPPVAGPCRIALARAPVDDHSPFLFHKTTRRDVYERLKLVGFDDTLLWNRRGEVTESTIASVVAELDGQRWTPPLTSGLLPGTMRAHLLASGQVRERIILKEELIRCTRLWLVNSVRGWRQAELVV